MSEEIIKLKSANCGDLRVEQVDTKQTLAGWVGRRRDHGGIIFIDLRDRSGMVQVVFNPARSPGSHRGRLISIIRPSDGWSWGRGEGEVVN